MIAAYGTLRLGWDESDMGLLSPNIVTGSGAVGKVSVVAVFQLRLLYCPRTQAIIQLRHT